MKVTNTTSMSRASVSALALGVALFVAAPAFAQDEAAPEEEEGIVVCQSSGAAIWAALQVGREIDEGVIVVISPDFGDRYLSTNLWLGWREWLDRNGAGAR